MGEQINNYFFKCNTTHPDLRQALLEKTADKNNTWQNIFGIDVCNLSPTFFEPYDNVYNLFKGLGNNRPFRYSIFRFQPNTCYGWHIDYPGRTCALNLLIDGKDSHTFCGENVKDQEKKNDYINVSRVDYPDDSFILLNVQKSHTIYNFDNTRYVLTVSIDPPWDFEKTKTYLLDNNF